MPLIHKNLYYPLLIVLCAAVSISGCAPAAQPAQTNQAAEAFVLPTDTPEATPVPTEPPPATRMEPPATDPPAIAQADWTTAATVEGDYYVLGNPQAPIRLIDFSDFF